MGLFLAVSCVVGGNQSGVERVLSAFTAERKGVFAAAAGDLPEDEMSWLLESPAGAAVLYPEGFADWDAASAQLSRDLKAPVFSFHIHDGDFWMFVAFNNGREALKFNPIPDYWEELAPAERAKWLPTAAEVAALVPGAAAQKLAPYLREWPTDDPLSGQKANPEDEFKYGVDWQVVDFMRQLGFAYPDPDRAIGYRFLVR